MSPIAIEAVPPAVPIARPGTTSGTVPAADGHLLVVEGMSKRFVRHLQGGVVLPVVSGVALTVGRGECVVLGGRSGVGKSSILKMVWGSYGVSAGRILVADGAVMVDVATAEPRAVLALRRRAMGYVSQFLRVVPRVPTRTIVAEPLLAEGVEAEAAVAAAEAMLDRLALPRRLWDLPPATFSGGEQQRVNVARGFVRAMPLMLLDEPTASLDGDNRAAVVALIAERKRAGTGFLGIFHDERAREAVADRVVDVAAFAPVTTEDRR